jgi:hypothetical protein
VLSDVASITFKCFTHSGISLVVSIFIISFESFDFIRMINHPVIIVMFVITVSLSDQSEDIIILALFNGTGYIIWKIFFYYATLSWLDFWTSIVFPIPGNSMRF